MYIFYHILHSLFFSYELSKYAHYVVNGQVYPVDNYGLLHYSILNLVPDVLINKGIYQIGEIPIAPWNEFVPFHLSDIGQICCAILLITRSKVLFDITFPILCLMPFASIFSPEKIYWNYNNYFFWEFYFNHSMMILIPWWFYLYGVKPYNSNSLRWSYIFLFCFALLAFLYDYLLNTNLLYVGFEGWSLFNGVTTSNILTGYNIWGVSLLSMTIFGSAMLFISSLLIILINPFYSYIIEYKIFKKSLFIPWNEKIIPLKELFIWNRNVIFKSKPGHY